MESTPDRATLENALAALRADEAPAADLVAPPRPLGLPRPAVAVLPGAFDPPTLAHLALARAVRDETGRAVLFAVGTRTVDKEDLEERLPRAERAALLAALGGRERDLGVVLVNRGLYVEQAEAIRKALPGIDDLAFVVGMDKLPQIFDARYYGDLERSLRELFARARLIVAARGGLERHAFDRILGSPPARPFADRVQWLELDPRWRSLSSSEVRRRLDRGEPVDDLVPPEVLARLDEVKRLRRNRR